jgi:hypothetical protein
MNTSARLKQVFAEPSPHVSGLQMVPNNPYVTTKAYNVALLYLRLTSQYTVLGSNRGQSTWDL